MKRNVSVSSREDGVSEVVGFIIIFGIMVTGIALVTLYGYPLLLKEQQSTNVRNMERTMIVLQNDLKSLTYKSVPYEETSLQVSGGTLSVKKEAVATDPYFTVSWAGGPSLPRFYSGEIHFESQDGSTTLSLENGAVHTTYWSSPNGSAMLSEPRWFYDKATKTFVMTFIQINASDNLTQTGIGTVRTRLNEIPQLQPYTIPASTPVYVTYQGTVRNNYNIAWRNYFNNTALGMSPDDLSSNLYSKFKLPEVNTLVIKQYNVTLLSL